MSLSAFLTLRAFRPDLADPAFPLADRLAAHRQRRLALFAHGERPEWIGLEMIEGHWRAGSAPTQGTPCLILTTPRSLTCEVRELPALPGGNHLAAINRALAEQPKTVLQEAFEADRVYQALPLGAGRSALVCSVRESDIKRADSEAQRRDLPVVGISCGLAVTAQVALTQIAATRSEAHAAAILDQHACLVLGLRAGRPDLSASMAGVESSHCPAATELRQWVHDRARQNCGADLPRIDVYSSGRAVLSADAFGGPGVECRAITLDPAALCFA